MRSWVTPSTATYPLKLKTQEWSPALALHCQNKASPAARHFALSWCLLVCLFSPLPGKPWDFRFPFLHTTPPPSTSSSSYADKQVSILIGGVSPETFIHPTSHPLKHGPCSGLGSTGKLYAACLSHMVGMVGPFNVLSWFDVPQ